MSHIFISYSRQDIDFARYVRALLENQGFWVWMDEKRLSAGMDWWDEIENNIDSCTAFLVIMSPDSRESVFVRNEILRALDQKKPLFPILFKGKHFGMLAHAQHEDMRGGLHDTFSSDFLNRLRDMVGIAPKRTVRVEVIHNAIQSVDADVLLLKYAAGFHGADLAISRLLRDAKIDLSRMPLHDVGDYHLVNTQNAINAEEVVFVRTPSIGKLGYRQVREFANHGLSILGKERPNTKHIAMTIHGVNTWLNLDEGESMLAQLAGLVDVLQAWQAPRALEKISIVEYDEERFERIKDALFGYFEEVEYAQPAQDVAWGYDLSFERETQIEAPDAGEQDIKPYAVAIFPEDPELEDVFFYGIERPVHAMGLLCERVTPQLDEVDDEQEQDQLQLTLQRIKSASVVICDVTEITPLLYLHLGYAWGSGIPTALITRKDDKPLGTDSSVQYEKIWQLEERLAQWLKTMQ